MDLGSWAMPVMAVGALGGATLIFALFVGRWIDAQSNTVIGKPQAGRKKRKSDE